MENKSIFSKSIVLISSIVIVVLAIFIFVSMKISYNNQDASYRSDFTAQEKIIEMTYDNMWKTINGVAQVSEQYKESFKDIYVKIIDKRYSTDSNLLMKWIQESNPNFDSKLYDKVNNVIISERYAFLNAQKKITDIENQHRKLLTTFPGNFLVSNNTPLQYEVISSTKTKKVMETRMDDDNNIFGK